MPRRNHAAPRHKSRARSKKPVQQFEGGFLLRLKISRYKNHTTITLSYKRPQVANLPRFINPTFIGAQVRRFTAPAMIVLGLLGLLLVFQPYVGGSELDVHSERSSALSPVAQASSFQQEPPEKKGLPRSEPVSLSIPSIHLSTAVLQTGTNEAGELVVPEVYDSVAWYNQSPTPGEIGPSVIVGHLSSLVGDAVFAALHTLPVGSEVHVHRADGRKVVFTVERVVNYSQRSFPASEVYGNTPQPELRLITCSAMIAQLLFQEGSSVCQTHPV